MALSEDPRDYPAQAAPLLTHSSNPSFRYFQYYRAMVSRMLCEDATPPTSLQPRSTR